MVRIRNHFGGGVDDWIPAFLRSRPMPGACGEVEAAPEELEAAPGEGRLAPGERVPDLAHIISEVEALAGEVSVAAGPASVVVQAGQPWVAALPEASVVVKAH